MSTKKKILVIVPPASGHLNPVLCIFAEILKHQPLDVIFYSEEPFREQIEKIGATYRAFSHPTYSRVNPQGPVTETTITIGGFITKQIEVTHDVLPQLLHDVETDVPDLIFYDSFFLMSSFLLEVIKTRNEAGSWNRKVPKSVTFSPNFPPCDKLIETIKKERPQSWWSYMLIVDSFRRQFMLSWRFGVSVYNPINLCIKPNEVLNIVSVPGELQPFREEFNDTFKFIGPCVNDEARSVEISNNNDDDLTSLLNQFNESSNKSLKLIYVSMGTVFLANTFIFDRIFEAFNNYNSKSSRRFKLEQFRVIVSLGASGLKIYSEKIAKGELDMPANIILKAKVPQLEVLKRADLFITHCGMNSTTETIKYAVPVVVIPIDGDQPINAKRICNDLEFGVRLDVLKLKSDEIADSIDEVLSNDKYKKNISEMSKAIQKYNGAVEGSRLVLDYLNK